MAQVGFRRDIASTFNADVHRGESIAGNAGLRKQKRKFPGQSLTHAKGKILINASFHRGCHRKYISRL